MTRTVTDLEVYRETPEFLAEVNARLPAARIVQLRMGSSAFGVTGCPCYSRHSVISPSAAIPEVTAFDVLILGSGLAGQSLALRLADKLKVALITKRTLEDSASAWAQGGIAAVLDPADSTEAHIADTHTAGAGLCSDKATRFVVENGPRAIHWLIEHGVAFTPDSHSPIGFHLTREGGHGQRRVIHVADATGAAVQATLTEQVDAWCTRYGRAAGSVVHVRMGRIDPTHAELVVSDWGPGIPPQERALVFERFYRSTTARAMPGSGLGLAIVQQVVLKHGGALRIEDTVPGGTPPGTSIHLVLPGRPSGVSTTHRPSGLDVAGATTENEAARTGEEV